MFEKIQYISEAHGRSSVGFFRSVVHEALSFGILTIRRFASFATVLRPCYGFAGSESPPTAGVAVGVGCHE